MIKSHFFAVIISLIFFTGCEEEAKKKTKNASSGQNNQNQNNQNQNAQQGNNQGQIFYTGFNSGGTSYSLILPPRSTYRLENENIARIEQVQVALSEKTIDELLKPIQDQNPGFDVSRFRGFLGRTQTGYKVIPSKAGTVTIYIQRQRRGGGRGGFNNGGFGQQEERATLVINEYSDEQIAAGKKRYSEAGEGNLKACESCHKDGEEGAPPHELGEVMRVSDQEALQWVTTGSVRSRQAKIDHTWEFRDDAEKNGIVAYLRAKQTSNPEEFTRLIIEERLESFQANVNNNQNNSQNNNQNNENNNNNEQNNNENNNQNN